MKKELIFTGVVKKIPNCGVSMKNKLFIERFREVFDKVWIVGVKKSPMNLYFLPLQIMHLILLSLIHPQAIIVVSSNSWESNIIIKVLDFFKQTKRIRFWVAGGSFHEFVGKSYSIELFKKLYAIYVQSPKMVMAMKQKGFENVYYVPNSKRIDYLPTIQPKQTNNEIKFVFLSRVHPDKGCGLIFDSVKRLNEIVGSQKFSVDFYGEIFPEYKQEFLQLVSSYRNVSYKGFLNLTEKEGYDTLAQYDVMLFPTYWHGEGFPGVVIDAYISGLPIIASDWNFNTDVVTENTGVIIPHHDQKRLEEEMMKFINGKYEINSFRHNCQNTAKEYDNRLVLSEQHLKQIGMIK